MRNNYANASKMQIAMQSDDLNNKDVQAYNDDEYQKEIRYFEESLSIMPNNDDALKILNYATLKLAIA